MTTQLQKQRSKKLDELLAALAPDFDKLKPKVDAVFEQGRKEGFTDMKIGDLVRLKMEEHYSQSTIKRVLPDTAKHQEKVRNQNFAPKMSANEREPIEVPADKVQVEPTNKLLPAPEVRMVEGIRNVGPIAEASNESNEEEDTPINSPISVEEEQEHDESIDDQYHFIRGLTELMTGLKENELLNSNDNFKLAEETKQYRLGVVKRLDDINLKTIYGNVRTLAIVLNYYAKQLDNEVGVRQSKEELMSE